MPRVEGVDKLVSVVPRKRVGLPRNFGYSVFGQSVFGSDEIYLVGVPFGTAPFGDSHFGEIVILSGVFRKNTNAGPRVFNRVSYMTPKNPQSEPQQAHRQKLTDGVVAWQALTPTEKAAYNERVSSMRMSGYNLFLREYILAA